MDIKSIKDTAAKTAAKAGETAAKAGKTAAKAGKNVYKKAGEVKKKIDAQTKVRTTQVIDENVLLALLDDLYKKALTGIPKVSDPVEKLADDYFIKYGTTSKAAKALLNAGTAKCGASGFLTGLGGFITMPVTIPANLGSLLYMQIRMAAAAARLGGFDIYSEETKALVYVCLTGRDAHEILKKIHTETARNFTTKAGDILPNKMFSSVSHKMDFRFIVKFIAKRSVRFIDAVPVAGGVFGGALDAADTKKVADNAFSLFIVKELPGIAGPDGKEDNI